MDFILEADSFIPKHQLIAADLMNQINQGIYPVGSLLPGEFELAKKYAVSRNTIRTALSTLERSFRIQRLRGKGTIVLPLVDPENKSQYASHGFANYLRNNYHGGGENNVRTHTLIKKKVPCPESLRASFPAGVADGEMLLYERVYLVNETPAAVIVSFIQTRELNCIEQYDFEVVSLSTVIRTLGIEFRYRQGHCKAVLASREIAEILAVPEGYPLICYMYEAYGANIQNAPTLEAGTIYLNTDNVPFIVNTFQ